MDDKAEDFVECLLYDMFELFIKTVELDLELSMKFEPKRCIPDNFHRELLDVGKVFMKELSDDMDRQPVLLCWSTDLFKRFANSVCLKLIDNVDPEVDFLKVMSFLTVIMYTSSNQGCYRWFNEIPKILETLLKERIRTKFYEEDGFDAILEKCRQLKEDEEWCQLTVEEMRTCINDSLKTEMAATKRPSRDDLFEDRTKIGIEDAHSYEKFKSYGNCPLCALNCLLCARAFFKPKIIYKPQGEEMQ